MKIVLLRVGIDSGAGGMQGPLLDEDKFEFLSIPDGHGVDARTYGNTVGRHCRALVDYFPPARRAAMAGQSMHVDPEWQTYTYGDPTPPKAVLRRLQAGDLLLFYCGLQHWNPSTGWDSADRPALYLAGYFEVARAGLATDFDPAVLQREFAANFHVRHRALFEAQKEKLVLIKGDPARSRLFDKAHCISSEGRDRNGVALKVLSKEAQLVFGGFDGLIAIQRSTPRWVQPEFVTRAADFIRSLE